MWNLKRKMYKRRFYRGQFRRPTPAARKGGLSKLHPGAGVTSRPLGPASGLDVGTSAGATGMPQVALHPVIP